MHATIGSYELGLRRLGVAVLARAVLATGLCSLTSGVWAQQSPGTATSPSTSAPAPAPRETPRPDQLEPGVDTSSTAASSPSTSAPAPAVGTATGAATPTPNAEAAAGSKAAAPATRRKSGSQAKSDPTPTADNQAAPVMGQPKSGARGGKAQDRLELDTTQITGNRELPKVLYIVPWKRSDLGDLVGKPVNSLLDEVLEPVDRDVFKRENRYYDALKPDQTKQGTVTVEGSGDKR